MLIQTNGFSEVVLEVKDMKRAVDFWSGQLGFPIVEKWSYKNGHFSDQGTEIWATWLYVGGYSRLGLWLPRKFNELELLEKSKPVTGWTGLYDEGGIHAHIALHINISIFEDVVSLLGEKSVDVKIINEEQERRLYFKDTEDNVIEFYTLDMRNDYKTRLKKINKYK